MNRFAIKGYVENLSGRMHWRTIRVVRAESIDHVRSFIASQFGNTVLAESVAESVCHPGDFGYENEISPDGRAIPDPRLTPLYAQDGRLVGYGIV